MTESLRLTRDLERSRFALTWILQGLAFLAQRTKNITPLANMGHANEMLEFPNRKFREPFTCPEPDRLSTRARNFLRGIVRYFLSIMP